MWFYEYKAAYNVDKNSMFPDIWKHVRTEEWLIDNGYYPIGLESVIWVKDKE